MNVKLIVQYDGSDYFGFGRQPGLPTIQGELESSLKKVLQEDVRVIGAGRTDAGVHALGQVVNFKTLVSFPWPRLGKAMSSFLSDNIRVIEACEAPSDFHARKSAHSKKYVYTVFNGEHIPYFLWRFAFHEPQILWEDKIRQVLSNIQGEHDFKAFSVSGGSSQTSCRRIFETGLEVSQLEGWGRVLKFTFVGNGFLYKMVRRLMWYVRAVGLLKLKPDQIFEAFESQDKRLVLGTMPPEGLCLEKVIY